MSALVLIIDRPGAFRDALAKAVEARGARADARDDAMEALAALRELSPSVVLVSDQAGPPDAQSLCRILRRKLSDTPVYRLGEPDFSDPLGGDGQVLPRLADPQAVAAAVLGPKAAIAPNAAEWEAELERWQLPRALLALAERRSTGHLVLQAGSVEREIGIVRGLPVCVRSSAVEERLGAVLVRAGLLGRDALQHALDHARARGARLGEILLASKSVEAPALYRGLALQVREQLMAACEGGPYRARFVPQDDLGVRVTLLPFHPMSVLLEAALRLPGEARDGGLARVTDSSLGATAMPDVDAWLRALGIAQPEALLQGGSTVRALVDALRAALPAPSDHEPKLDPNAIALTLLWSGRYSPRTTAPAALSVPPVAPVPGGWLRGLANLKAFAIPTPARPISEAANDVQRAVDEYLLSPRPAALARRRALDGCLVDTEHDQPERIASWCTLPGTLNPLDARAVAALVPAEEPASQADPLALRCRRLVLLRSFERAPKSATIPPPVLEVIDPKPLVSERRSSVAHAPVPPPPPPQATTTNSEERALFAEVEPLVQKGDWQALVELFAKRDQDAPPLSPRLGLLHAIALKEAAQPAVPGKQALDPDLLGVRAVSSLLQIGSDNPTALIVGKRLLRRRPLEWQNEPPRRFSLLVTGFALILGGIVGLLFNQRLIDLIWK